MKWNARLGFSSEMRVVSDMILRGYEVYMASRTNNDFDILVRCYDTKTIFTVEVKTSRDLKLRPSMLRTKPDILALVDPVGAIKYVSSYPINAIQI